MDTESSAQDSELVGLVLAERYQIDRAIGRGAMGGVYEAHHKVLGRRFAVKVLDQRYRSSSARERFFHEARAAGAIAHQHIVPVVDFGLLESGQPYLVMEYVDGQTLEIVVEREAPLSADDAVEICAQLLSALEVIHGSGLVHRDIKPANVMLVRVRRPRYFAKLLDFGVSRAMTDAWHRPDLTRINEILGTPAYFSPEQAEGQPIDHRCDLWAVGTILYEMLSGDLPFPLESVDQVIDDLGARRLVPLRHRAANVPEWLHLVVQRAHASEVERRFQSATEFLEALETRNPFPEADDDSHVRTQLFVRVDLEKPPPSLLGRETAAGGCTDGDATRIETPQARIRALSDIEIPTADMEPPGLTDEDDELTVQGARFAHVLAPTPAFELDDTVTTDGVGSSRAADASAERQLQEAEEERDAFTLPAVRLLRRHDAARPGEGRARGGLVALVIALLGLVAVGIVAYIALGTF